MPHHLRMSPPSDGLQDPLRRTQLRGPREGDGDIRPDATDLLPETDDALLSNGGTVLLPPESKRVEVEAELAVILGNGGSFVPAHDALELVAGCAVFFDITARDLQAKAREEGSPWTAAKGFDTFAPMSEPVSWESIPDPHALGIRLKVNGTLRQDSNTDRMVFRIPQLIEAASGIMTLEAGDVIATGTPAGVWPIVPGDRLEAEIARVGTLRCTVAARNR